jgi:hypothetical protein
VLPPPKKAAARAGGTTCYYYSNDGTIKKVVTCLSYSYKKDTNELSNESEAVF